VYWQDTAYGETDQGGANFPYKNPFKWGQLKISNSGGVSGRSDGVVTMPPRVLPVHAHEWDRCRRTYLEVRQGTQYLHVVAMDSPEVSKPCPEVTNGGGLSILRLSADDPSFVTSGELDLRPLADYRCARPLLPQDFGATAAARAALPGAQDRETAPFATTRVS
jgi:hypothetical protein